MSVARPEDIELSDPPCLRSIDTRIKDGKLHFIVYFRSWELWSGMPANLGAIQLLKEYMSAEIGVEDGEIIASSKGLHLYSYAWDLSRQRANRKGVGKIRYELEKTGSRCKEKGKGEPAKRFFDSTKQKA